jgi:methylmalonyl-CoA/ethylmalonyl-CoA epimerase
MDLRRIHHVAISHGETSVLLDVLADPCGLRVDHVEHADGFTERMWAIGDGFVQTLEATGEGIIQRSLDSRGPGVHHIAFEVDDIDAALAELRSAGTRLIDDYARPGGAGTRIAFLHPSAFGGVLVELVEEPRAVP